MKVLSSLLLFSFCLLQFQSIGQITDMPFECISPNLKYESKDIATRGPNYLVCNDDEISFFRVNVHFMLTEDPENPGNFTEVDNGLGDPCANGYIYADQMIKNANDNWNKNYQAQVYPNNEIPEYRPKKVQLILQAVYFHRSDIFYDAYGLASVANNYAVDTDEVINIFSMEVPSNTTTGGAVPNDLPTPAFHLRNAWQHYNNTEPCNLNSYDFARITNHELGHLFGLCHSFSCDNACADTDIDIIAECNENGNCGFSCGGSACANWTSGSNNLMGYNAVANALTPCQLEIVQATIQSSWGNYIEYCCSDWGIDSITCCNGLVPGIKMLPAVCHDIVSIDDDRLVTLQQQINVFPNPVSNKLNINYDDITIEYIEILSVSSQDIKTLSQTDIQNGSVEVSSLPQGIHFLKIKIKEQSDPLMIKFLKL